LEPTGKEIIVKNGGGILIRAEDVMNEEGEYFA
jgi:hypothetical protein